MNITKILRKFPPGHWVVLNEAMTKVLGDGKTPKAAAAKATKRNIAPRDQFLLRVPAPGAVCIY